MTYYCDERRHLVCLPYSTENLHKMAADLKIGRHWYHHGDHPHYDIPRWRTADIPARCTRVSSRDIVRIIRGTYRPGVAAS